MSDACKYVLYIMRYVFVHRDIVKKKRDEHIKMVWRVSPSHKRLQARMEHMRRFRRHHEQLRTVMLRVSILLHVLLYTLLHILLHTSILLHGRHFVRLET